MGTTLKARKTSCAPALMPGFLCAAAELEGIPLSRSSICLLVLTEAIGIGATRRCQEVSQELDWYGGEEWRQLLRYICAVRQGETRPARALEKLPRLLIRRAPQQPDAWSDLVERP